MSIFRVLALRVHEIENGETSVAERATKQELPFTQEHHNPYPWEVEGDHVNLYFNRLKFQAGALSHVQVARKYQVT